MRFLLLLFVIVTTSFAATEPAKRAIRHEDLWLMKRLGAPVVSPDGKWAVFSVTEPDYDPKNQTADLWIVATDGSAPARKLTQTKAPETAPRWSPDGSRLAFSSKRDGDEAPQIYVLNVAAGGEAERITRVSTGARTPEWSPDGKRVLFVSEVYPGAYDEEANQQAAQAIKARKYTARVYDGFPIKHWDRWLDDRKVHLFVQDARPGAPARDLFARTRFANLPGFGGKEADGGADLPATWSPDGKTIVFAAATNRNEAAFEDVPTQLFEVAADGGEPRPLTSDRHSYGEVRFSADGRHLLAMVEAGGDGKTYHHERVAAFAWPFDAKSRRIITADLDLSVSRFVVDGSDPARVYLLADEGDRTKLFSAELATGNVKKHEVTETGCLTGLSAGGGVLVALHDSAAFPANVVRVAPGRPVERLTRFHDDAIAGLDLPPVERFTVPNVRGDLVQSLVVRPAGFDASRKYPLFVVIHGGPAPQFKDSWGLRWNYQLLAAPGYVLLLTNYSGSSGYSEAFGQAIQSDPLRGPADEINQAADEAIRRYPFIDGSRQAAGGASYGGHLANWLQATTTRYRCLISHAGLVNLETQWATSDSIYHRELNNGGPIWEQGAIWREQNPVRLVGNHFKGTGWKTPMLVTVGENDFRVPANNALENWTYLQRLRVPSRLIVFPDENHWILKGENSRFWFSEVHAWLAKWLGE